MHVSTNDHLHTHMTHKYLLENKYVLNFMLSCKSYSRYFDALPLDFHPMILLPGTYVKLSSKTPKYLL